MEFECGADVETEMERLKKEFEDGGKAEDHPSIDRYMYMEKQIELMKLILTQFGKSYSFRERMKIRAGIFALEQGKKILH